MLNYHILIILYNFYSITLTYKAYCSEGYYGNDCSGHCPGNPRKCVVNGTTYCKTGKLNENTIWFYKSLKELSQYRKIALNGRKLSSLTPTNVLNSKKKYVT